MSKCIVQYYEIRNGVEVNTDISIVDFTQINKEYDEKDPIIINPVNAYFHDLHKNFKGDLNVLYSVFKPGNIRKNREEKEERK